MADITRLGKLVQGLQRNIDISNNTLVTLSIKVGGPTSNTELTKAILDNLVTLQNGSDAGALHHHDGRYFTETELGSTTGTSGASLIGILDATSQFIGTTVEAALDEAMDAAQAAQTAANAAQEDVDDLVTLSGVAVNAEHLGTFTGTTIPDSSTIKDALQAVETAVESAASSASAAQEDIDDLVTLSGVAVNAEHLGAFTGSTIPDNQTIKAAIQALETAHENALSLIQNFEWQESVIDRLDTPPLSPASGDRYLVLATATGAWVGKEDKIAEWDGSAWLFTDPTTGMYLAVDDENDGLYLYGGSSWTKKYFESTTASTGLIKVGFDIRLADANVNGLNIASGVFTVNVDGTSIERGVGAGNPLQIKFGTSGLVAVSASDLASTSNGKGASLIGIEDVADQFTATNVEAALAEALDAAQAAQADVDAVENDVGHLVTLTGVAVDSDNLGTFTGTTIPDNSTIKAALQAVETAVEEAKAAADAIKIVFVAGENLAAGDVVRLSQTTAGQVLKADADAIATCEGVVGIATQTVSASAEVAVQIAGKRAVNGTFASSDIGKRVYVSTTAGECTPTAPTAEDSVVFLAGTLIDHSTKEVVLNFQLVGIN